MPLGADNGRAAPSRRVHRTADFRRPSPPWRANGRRAVTGG